METTLEYMARKHEILIDNYRTPNKAFMESCGLIAINIARSLLVEGKEPYVMLIHGKILDRAGNRSSIIPKRFQKTMKEGWGAYQICCENGFVYDPMESAIPMKIKKYFETAFDKDVKREIIVTKAKIEDFVTIGGKEPLIRN